MGHRYTFSLDDLDGGSKDEVLAGGTNNALASRGASMFILDEKHWGGASVDTLASPVGSIEDSALVRVVFPDSKTLS